MNKVLVTSLDKSFVKFEKSVEKKALEILGLLKQKKSLVEIFLIDSKEIKKINKKFRGKDKPTNVLSFEEPREFILPSKEKMLGEIYLNLEMTRDWDRLVTSNQKPDIRGKRKKNKEEFFDIQFLLIHGILHLIGYDHERSKHDEAEMTLMEEKLVGKLVN